MSAISSHTNSVEDNRARQHPSSQNRLMGNDLGPTHTAYGATLLSRQPFSGGKLSGRGNGTARTISMQAMQSTHGNRAVQRFMQQGSTQNTSKVAVQRSAEFPYEDMFPEQAYDTPTPEEMAKLEEMYQKGLAEDGAAEAGAGEAGAAEAGAAEAGAAEVGAAEVGAAEVGAAEVGAAEAGAATVAEGGAAAGGLGAGAILPLAAAGAAGFGIGTAIGEYGIDPYLNRPHMEDASDSDNYKDKWNYKINHWLGEQ